MGFVEPVCASLVSDAVVAELAVAASASAESGTLALARPSLQKGNDGAHVPGRQRHDEDHGG